MRASLSLLVALTLPSACQPAAVPPVVVAPSAPPAIAPAPPPPAPPQAPRAIEPVAADPPTAPTTPPPATEGLAGACADPLAHRGEKVDASDPVRVPPELQLDLDGDGRKDVVVLAEAAGAVRTYALYVRRKGCAHYVGEVSAATGLKALAQRRSGLVNLAGLSDDCAASGGGWCDVVYAFDGKAYRRISEKAAPEGNRNPLAD